jgi:hypothetical protein
MQALRAQPRTRSTARNMHTHQTSLRDNSSRQRLLHCTINCTIEGIYETARQSKIS